MATANERDAVRAKIFELVTYWPVEIPDDVDKEILKGRFDWDNNKNLEEKYEDLINDANNNAELGYLHFDGEFSNAAEEIVARLQGFAENIVHEKIAAPINRHRLIVNNVLGKWYSGRVPAWNGTICATLGPDGKPIIVRTIPIMTDNIKHLDY